MSHFLLKSEATCYSIDDLEKDGSTLWTGIRNYQARNFMRDMKIGDLCLFYHSSSTDPLKPNGVYGVVRVIGEAKPDPTQFDPKDDHYDPKATKDKPIWDAVEVEHVSTFEEPISLTEIKRDPKLSGIAVAQTGSRLSVLPVSDTHFAHILELGGEE